MTTDELPDSWQLTTLGEIGQVTSGGTPSTKDDTNFGGSIAWITPADLTDYGAKYIEHGRRNITVKGLRASSATLLPPETVCFSSRAPIGYVAIAKSALATNQGFKNLTPDPGILSEFVYYYLKGSKSLAESYASGTTFLEIPKRQFSKLPIPLAPTNEQRRIVAKLDELFSKLDAGVEALKQTQVLLKRYRQSVLKAAVEGKLTREWREARREPLEPASVLLERIRAERAQRQEGKRRRKEPSPLDTSDLPELPEGWAWTRVSDLALSMKNGIYKKAEYYTDDGSGIPCLRMYNIDAGQIVWHDIKRMRLTEIEAEEYGLEHGDLLVNRVNSRELVGKTAAIPANLESCVYESKNIRLRLHPSIHPEYASFCFQVLGRRHFESNFQQTVGMASINQQQLSTFRVPMPPVEEQGIVVDLAERLLSIADETTASAMADVRRATHLRQSILQRAFTGRLVPQDPNDEPASVLLERIQAEKAANGGKRPTARKAAAQERLF